MPVRKSQKIEAQVVEAIRKLQAVQGSTPREISNYIAQEYDIADSEIRRHVQLALKRGVVYGILQRLKGQVGYYTYNQDFLNCMNSGDAINIPCERRRRGRRRSSRRRRRRSGRRRRYGRRKSRRRRSRRRRSRSRRRRSRRRRRAEFPKEIDEIQLSTLSKQQTKSNSLLGKDGPESNHSTISEQSEEKQE
ncbi:hypothetical protein ANTQUA_LOCUS9290 [Anthophora quadrimaculata]